MEIKILDNKYKLEVINHVIRDALVYVEDGPQVLAPCFQAIVESKTDKDYQSVDCRLSYYDSSGKFIGLDSQTLWQHKAQSKMSLSMQISAPENASNANFEMDAKIQENEFSALNIILVGITIAVCVWGVGYAINFIS